MEEEWLLSVLTTNILSNQIARIWDRGFVVRRVVWSITFRNTQGWLIQEVRISGYCGWFGPVAGHGDYVVVIVVVKDFLASNLALVPVEQAASEVLCPKELKPLTHLMGGWENLWPSGQLSHLWKEVRWVQRRLHTEV